MLSEFQVRQFMEDQLGIFDNPSAVEISYSKGQITVCSYFPGYIADTSLSLVELFTEHLTLQDFIDCYALTSLSDIYNINSDHVYEKYLKGIGGITCSYDGNNILYFKKRENGLVATNDQRERHPVRQLLSEPKDFIAYTKAYFEQPGIVRI